MDFSDISDEEIVLEASQSVADFMLNFSFDERDKFSDIETESVHCPVLDSSVATGHSASATPPVKPATHLGEKFHPPKADDELKHAINDAVPASTNKKTEWACNLFEKWRQHRNNLAAFQTNLSNIGVPLAEMSDDELNYCISRFIWEVKKQDCTDFPPQTLYEIVCGLQRKLQQVRPIGINFFNDALFKELRESLDAVMKSRTAQGLGLQKKHAEVLSADHVRILREKALLGFSSPQVIFLSNIILLSYYKFKPLSSPLSL